MDDYKLLANSVSLNDTVFTRAARISVLLVAQTPFFFRLPVFLVINRNVDKLKTAPSECLTLSHFHPRAGPPAPAPPPPATRRTTMAPKPGDKAPGTPIPRWQLFMMVNGCVGIAMEKFQDVSVKATFRTTSLARLHLAPSCGTAFSHSPAQHIFPHP